MNYCIDENFLNIIKISLMTIHLIIYQFCTKKFTILINNLLLIRFVLIIFIIILF